MSTVVVRTERKTVAFPRAPVGGTGATGASGAPGANVMAVGLFTALAALSVPLGTTLIQTAGHTNQGQGHAIYVEDASLDDAAVAAQPAARAKTSNGRYFRLSHEQPLNPYMFGATGRGAASIDDGAAFLAADAYLETILTNPSSGDFYAGNPALWITGDFFLDDTTLEPKHGTQWIGAGASHFWGGGAGTRMRWADGVHGFIPQTPNTSDIDTVDVGTHRGAAHFKAIGIRFEGGYSGDQANEGLWHGAVPRCPHWFEDCHFINWSGIGHRSWAGNVTGVGNVGGNVSESVRIRCKYENCYVGYDNRGSDANIQRGIGNAYYQNRLAGFIDDNGAGSNVEMSPHFAFNGRVNNPNYWTQTSTGGYRYALRIGGNKNNAPSGAATHTADWLFIEAGGAIAGDIPTYNAALDFRAGGDALTLNVAGVSFHAFYSESGGLSQFNGATGIFEGSLSPQYYFGGWRWATQGVDGYALQTNSTNMALLLDNNNYNGFECMLAGRKNGVTFAYFDMVYGGSNLYNAVQGHTFRVAGSYVGSLDTSGYMLPTGSAYYINGQQVLGARRTGWGAPTGTPTRTTFDTASVTLPQLAERVKALIDDLTASGPIGA